MRTRRSLHEMTLALPFGTSPLDSEEGCSFLQWRLTLFAKIMFLLGAVAMATNATIAALSGNSSALLEWGVIQWHVTALLAALSVWLVGRTKRKLTIRPLFGLDGIGTLVVLGAYAVMGFKAASHAPERATLFMMMITMCTLITRAIIVPSTLIHTLGVTETASVPVLLLTYRAASTYPRAFGMAPLTATLYMSVWVVLSLLISVMASRVIYGLRVQVAHAQQLGQYTLGELIGQGAMGVVYKARHALLRRPTAIKLILPESAGPQMIKRFEREVQLTASLTHPNTVNIYDYGRTADGTFYYAMEYLDGINLEQLVTLHGPQDCRRVARILEQVAGSLWEAHQVGLVHRDIKPANVILCNRGGVSDVAKVVDFGLVKEATESGQGDPALTGINTIIGTPLYLAPEAILLPDKVDARSDLYALGALGYYLLAGVPVFVAKTVVEVCVMHANSEPVLPSVRAQRHLPAALENLIVHCLAKDPMDRPQTAKQFLEELSRASVGQWTDEEGEAWWAAHPKVTSISSVSPFTAARTPMGGESVVIDYQDRNRTA